MSEMPLPDDAGLRWLRWWCIDSWLAADTSWHQAEVYQLGGRRLAALARTHHPMICQRLQLSPDVAPVDAAVLSLLDMTAPQQQLALRLAAEICWRDSTQALLMPEQQRWCRRIAQAIRPGLWLTEAEGLPADDGDINGLWLLSLRVGPACWARLRLTFSAESVHTMEHLPQRGTFPSRLLPLWQAVFWYASQETLC